ncbi:hypothetical protein MYAM1_003798 [Malassezia yamatoensis]|uniref:NAD(P)-binding protein n=1 Tax=Malassezia yamatoensis TaxID=253288 RepID=A0AAJ6CI55_9BASI|nr:hypothetical protein MYAM1_003798 [Malassezia yamatoensis]
MSHGISTTSLVLVLALLLWRYARRRNSLRMNKISHSQERILILGASTEDGLGAAFLRQYLERGAAEILIVGRRQDALEKVRDSALKQVSAERTKVTKVHVFAADCTKSKDVIQLRDFVQAKLGGLDTLQIVFGATTILPILGLANVDPKNLNSSNTESTHVHADQSGLDSIANAVQLSSDANVKGTALVLGAFIPILQSTSNDPRVVATGSVAGLCPAPTRAVYCATKSAQHYLLDSVALECEAQAGEPILGTNQRRALVRFLILAPGPIRNSFVKTYSVDSASGPRDNRQNALDVDYVVKETLDTVDTNKTGMLVLPRAVFWVSLLTKFNSTYVLCQFLT